MVRPVLVGGSQLFLALLSEPRRFIVMEIGVFSPFSSNKDKAVKKLASVCAPLMGRMMTRDGES